MQRADGGAISRLQIGAGFRKILQLPPSRVANARAGSRRTGPCRAAMAIEGVRGCNDRAWGVPGTSGSPERYDRTFGGNRIEGGRSMPQNLRSVVSEVLRAQRTGAFASRAGAAAMLFALSGAAGAQQAGTPAPAPVSAGELEEVVVTGIRRSIESAIEVKREATSIVEAISAEDIGKLPDTSIADSLSRLPGLTSQRAEGRASAVSLRGTDPGFTSTLLNGREQVSTGDNRSIEFDQYPSELLSAVLVYKTPDAELVGQGLAGTVDLRTQRPLAYGKRAMVFNVRGERNSHNDLGGDYDDSGYRASFSYIDQFFDGRLGITFGVARLNSPLAQKGVGLYEPWHPNDPAVDGFNFQPDLPLGVYRADGIKARTDMGENTRDGALATIEFKPNDTWSSVLDFYYTKREQENNPRSLEVHLGNYPVPCCDGPFPPTGVGYVNPVIVNNTVVASQLTERVPLARNFLFLTEDKIFAAGWNNQLNLGDWTVTADVSYSKAEREEEQYEMNAQIVQRGPDRPPGTTNNVTDTGSFALTSQAFPQFSFVRNYADPATVQIGPTIYGHGYSKLPNTEDELKSARLDVERDLGWFFDTVAFGFNYSDRSKDKVQAEGNMTTRTGGFTRIADQFLLDPTNLEYAGAGQALGWDVRAVLNEYFAPIVYQTAETADFLISKNWSVQEKVSTAYVKGTMRHDLSDALTLTGNLGVQVVQTDQSSDALFKDNVANAIRPRTDGRDYTDVLPALNLALLMPEQQAVRMGISRQIARARMDQLKASADFGWSQTTGRPGGSGGNPRLSPWRADAFDLSYEKYFEGNRGYVSLAGFYKKLKTYIYNQTDQNYDFGEILANITFPPGYFAAGQSAQRFGSFTSPVNGEGGTLKGVEFTVSVPSELFWENVRGLGAIFSISQTNSNILVQDPPNTGTAGGQGGFGLGSDIPLPGLSKTVWNLTMYYENGGFSARVATRARSRYVGEVTNFANERPLRFVKGDEITDAQVGYAFSGRLEGLSVLFQVNNLTNSPYVAYSRIESRVQDYQEYGRQYLFGFNYRL